MTTMTKRVAAHKAKITRDINKQMARGEDKRPMRHKITEAKMSVHKKRK